MPGHFEIERLAARHDRQAFDCGNSDLSNWLKRYARQFDRRDLSRTFVATEPGGDVVVGYYALATHRVEVSSLPPETSGKLPQLDVPVVLLARLAVDRRVQGLGLGALLLIDALRRIEHVAQHTGVRAVEVDAIDDSAVRFYRKFGFIPLLDDKRHLYLPIRLVRELGLPPLE